MTVQYLLQFDGSSVNFSMAKWAVGLLLEAYLDLPVVVNTEEECCSKWRIPIFSQHRFIKSLAIVGLRDRTCASTKKHSH